MSLVYYRYIARCAKFGGNIDQFEMLCEGKIILTRMRIDEDGATFRAQP